MDQLHSQKSTHFEITWVVSIDSLLFKKQVSDFKQDFSTCAVSSMLKTHLGWISALRGGSKDSNPMNYQEYADSSEALLKRNNLTRLDKSQY